MKYRFGADLAKAVRVRGLTAQRLAELASVSPATIGSALRGREVQIATALQITRALTQVPVIEALSTWEEQRQLLD
jgi:predicted transcriptional regulator